MLFQKRSVILVLRVWDSCELYCKHREFPPTPKQVICPPSGRITSTSPSRHMNNSLSGHLFLDTEL